MILGVRLLSALAFGGSKFIWPWQRPGGNVCTRCICDWPMVSPRARAGWSADGSRSIQQFERRVLVEEERRMSRCMRIWALRMTLLL
jgi:hypothetical protein